MPSNDLLKVGKGEETLKTFLTPAGVRRVRRMQLSKDNARHYLRAVDRSMTHRVSLPEPPGNPLRCCFNTGTIVVESNHFLISA